MKKIFILFYLIGNNVLFSQQPQIKIQITNRPVNQYIHGYCNELWQWSRQHQDIDVFDPTFDNNFKLLNSQYGTFTNAMACVHVLTASGGDGYNYTGCKPFPTSTLACTTPSDCSADGMGCFTPHPFECYDKTNQYYSSRGISMGVNVNPYVSGWMAQNRYISKPIQAGVNVISIALGNELQQPTWYANSYYFPNAGIDYANFFNGFYTTCKPNYPNIPILMWATDIWASTNSIYYAWNNAVKSATYDGIHAYGLTSDIKKTLPPSTLTLNQMVDSVLTFNFWLHSWIAKKESFFGSVPISFDTYGTSPLEPMIGVSFLGEMQTALEQMCLQLYNGSSTIIAAQEYRTRSYNLQSISSATNSLVKIRQLRGELYGYASNIGTVISDSSKVVGIASCQANGNVVCMVLNFSNYDYPANVLINNVASSTPSITGYYTNNLLDIPDNLIYYTGGNVVKAKSITLLKIGNSTVGIKKLESNISGLEIFPNPAEENVYVKFNSDYDNDVKLELYNSIGQLIINKTIKCNKGLNQIELTTSELKKGVYSLIIINGQKKVSKKLFK